MPLIYDFVETPLQAGEDRDFTLRSESPAKVEIRCFVRKPPPPGYRACPECGSFDIRPNETINIRANLERFGNEGGTLEINVVDAVGENVQILLKVLKKEDKDKYSTLEA